MFSPFRGCFPLFGYSFPGWGFLSPSLPVSGVFYGGGCFLSVWVFPRVVKWELLGAFFALLPHPRTFYRLRGSGGFLGLVGALWWVLGSGLVSVWVGFGLFSPVRWPFALVL